METLITAVVLLAIVGLATWYVIRARKRGVKCIGCPDGAKCGSGGGCGSCSGGCSGNCSSCGSQR